MTSTVLDVTVMLLCVSASVVALSTGGLPNGAGTPTASESADRLSTETVTVTYADPSAPGGDRTIHATRAELLALLVSDDAIATGGDAAGGGERSANAFERRTLAAVAAGLDDRTRIDTQIRGVGSSGPSARRATARRRPGGSNEITRSAKTNHTEAATAVTVGSAPPRSADTTVAVLTQPIPGTRAMSVGHVRIVVRRW